MLRKLEICCEILFLGNFLLILRASKLLVAPIDSHINFQIYYFYLLLNHTLTLFSSQLSFSAIFLIVELEGKGVVLYTSFTTASSPFVVFFTPLNS